MPTYVGNYQFKIWSSCLENLYLKSLENKFIVMVTGEWQDFISFHKIIKPYFILKTSLILFPSIVFIETRLFIVPSRRSH